MSLEDSSNSKSVPARTRIVDASFGRHVMYRDQHLGNLIVGHLTEWTSPSPDHVTSAGVRCR